MSTPFLTAFANRVVYELVKSGRLDIEEGTEQQVIQFVASELGGQPGKPRSLISTLSKAIIDCPQVVELYVDDEELKQVVDEL